MTLSANEVNQLKQAQTIEGVLAAIVGRWSARSFAARAVSRADLKTIFEAARWSASSSNEQPWRFLCGERGSPACQKIASALNSPNRLWASGAPVLILGAAAGALTLQASALGLRTHSMAGFDHDAARQIFQIPEDFLLGAVIALGYQGEPAALPTEKLIAQEISPRSRRPLSETVFAEWGVPAELG